MLQNVLQSAQSGRLTVHPREQNSHENAKNLQDGPHGAHDHGDVHHEYEVRNFP